MEDTRIDRYRPLGRAGHPFGRQASLPASTETLRAQKVAEGARLQRAKAIVKSGTRSQQESK